MGSKGKGMCALSELKGVPPMETCVRVPLAYRMVRVLSRKGRFRFGVFLSATISSSGEDKRRIALCQ